MAARPRTQPSAADLRELQKEIRRPGSLPYARICVYGPNGGGKTRLLGTAPDPLIIDCNEEGDRSIQDVKRARVLDARSWIRIGEAYWYLKSGRHPFKSVGIDTITGMGELALDYVLDEAEERDPTREKRAPTQRDYGRAGKLMRGMLLAYRNLPMHVIFLAQERKIRDADTEELEEITVDLPGSSRGTAKSAVGILGRIAPRQVTVKKNGKKQTVWRDYLFVGQHEILDTKDRTFAVGPVMANPTMPKIIEAWKSNPPTEEE